MSEHKSCEEKTPEERVEAAAKLKACNDRSYARMAEINRIASETLVETTHDGYEPCQYGVDYITFGKAMCEIRKLVKESIFDVAPDYEMLAKQFARPSFDPNRLAEAIEALASEKPVDYPTFYTPGWLCDLAKKLGRTAAVSAADPASASRRDGGGTEEPAVSGCPSLGPKVFPSGADGTPPAGDDDKAKRQAEYFRRKYSFCDGLFPIRYTNTEDGVMASCWITGRRFTLDLDNNERDDGCHDCAAVIKDNGKVVATIETSRGKATSVPMAFEAFKAYVRNLSGSGRKFGSRGGFIKKAATKALIAKELA